MAERDYAALFPATWSRSGVVLSPSVQSVFLAENYSLVILGAGMGTTRVQELRQAVTNAGVTQEQAWYTKACGLHDPGAGAEDETSYGWATMTARNALSRTSYPAGAAVTNRWNGWRYVDILDNEGSGNNAAWITNQNALIDSMQARVNVDGVYIDNSSILIVTGSNSYTVNAAGDPATPGGYTDTAWYTATKAIVDGIVSGQSGKHVWVNSYAGFGAVGQRGLNLLQNAHGLFFEGFAAKIDGTGTPGYWTRSRFKQQIDDCVTALASYSGKHVVVIDDILSDDYQRRMFKLGAYLLAFNGTTRLKHLTRAMDTTSDLDLCHEYWAAIDQLDNALGAYTDDGTFLLRSFAGGSVIVNPDSGSHTYTLPTGAWEKLEVTGTTALGVNTAFWSAVSDTVTLPGHSALIVRQIGGLENYEITVNGQTRRYSLYLPRLPPAGRRPLIIGLHGGATNSNFFRTQSSLTDIADANNCLVAFPDGLPTGTNEYWNAYNCSSPIDEVDDVAFLEAVIDDIATTKTDTDLGRVYVTGFSAGGKMAHRLAAQIPERLAAVVAVSGGLTTLDPAVSQVPILHIHGAADVVVPYAGGEGTLDEPCPNLDIEAVVMPYWATRNGNDTTPTVTTPTGYTKHDFTDGSNTRTILYEVTDGTHAWDFGGTPARDANLPGGSTEAAVWDFVNTHYRAPVAALTASPTSGAATLAVTLDGSGSTSLDGILEYAFDNGSGSFGAWQSTATLDVSFATAGTKTVRLKVRDWAERESTVVSTTVTVTAALPVVTLTVTPSSGDAPLAVVLSASASGGAGGPYTYAFDKGEGAGYGAYGASDSLAHTYVTGGTYTAGAKAKDSATTESVADTEPVYVSTVAPPVIASFTASKRTVKRWEPITLAWSSTGAVTMTGDGDWRGSLPLSATAWWFVPYRLGDYELVLRARNSAGVEAVAKVRLTVVARGGSGSFLAG